jgi:cell division protein FtsW
MKLTVTTLIVCVTSLLALGLVMLYSASMTMVVTDKHSHVQSEVGARMLQMQLVWCVLGAIACAAVASLDHIHLKRFAPAAFGVSLFLAGLVFVPHVGMSLNGAHRWIRLPGATFQPSEIVKLGYILILAWYCDLAQRKMDRFQRGTIIPLGLMGLALGVIFVEPDRGTTILLAAVGGAMLIVAGSRVRYLLLIGLLAVAALGYSLAHDSMRRGRISAWLHPEAHLTGKALQAEQAKLALGSGGIFGKGLANGIEKQGYLPEIQSDFIFANIGEELGLVATVPVVLAYALIVLCGWYIAGHARDQFGSLLALGVTCLIGFQALINIGVVTSLLPNKGLALPFISAGGSSLLAMLIGVGLLLGVARQAEPDHIAASDVTPESNPFSARPAPAA